MLTRKGVKWMGGFGAALLAVTAGGWLLAGCGGNQTNDQSATTATGAAPTAAPNSTPAASASADKSQADLATFFPGATMTKKSVPLDDKMAQHLSGEAGLKFTGKESHWDVYEATQNGKRAGLAVLTHTDLPGGKDMHIAFAVDTKFTIIKTSVLEAPVKDKMATLLTTCVGKSPKDPFKLGKDLKAPTGVPAATAQAAADAVHKGVVMLNEFFNAAHSD